MGNIQKNDDLLVLFKKIAATFKSLAEKIEGVIANLGGRTTKGRVMNVNSLLKMVFEGRFAAIVVIQGTSTTSHATYIIQGYGISTARFHVTKIQGGEAISHTVSTTEQAVTFSNSNKGTQAVVSVFMLDGTLPIIHQ